MESYSSQSQSVTYRDTPETEAEVQTETDENGNVIAGSSDGEETPATQASGAPTYQESDGTLPKMRTATGIILIKKGMSPTTWIPTICGQQWRDYYRRIRLYRSLYRSLSSSKEKPCEKFLKYILDNFRKNLYDIC